MPTYDMKNVKTGEIKEMFLKISEKEKLVESGEWEQVHLEAMKIVRTTTSSLSKTSDGWKDHLKAIKQGSGKNNTIKV
jgi:hypothetical protein